MRKNIFNIFAIFLFVFICTFVANAEEMKFTDSMIWIQVGNQIKDVDDEMIDKIKECGFKKIVLLHSSIDDKGYFPKLNSIVKRAHKKGLLVSVGTLVFKDTFQKRYWTKHPDLRHRGKDGKESPNKYYHYQICPNNPLNHEYMADFMVRKARESGADEVHIDYEISPCYCDYCCNKFKEVTGLDAKEISETDPRWMEWRSKSTRDFFSLLARKCRTQDKPLMISSTAPVIGYAGGFSAYGTDMRYEDLTISVDEFQPMIYISVKNPPEMAGDKYEAIKIRVMGRKVVPGIIINEEGTMNIKTRERVEQEMRSLFEKGGNTLAVFEVRYINDELKDLFKETLK